MLVGLQIGVKTMRAIERFSNFCWLLVAGVSLGALLVSCGGNSASSNNNEPRESKLQINPAPTSKIQSINQPGSSKIANLPQSNSPAAGNSNRQTSTQVPSSKRSTRLEVERILTDLNARQTAEGVVVNLPADVLFDSDKATIRADASPTLAKINQLLIYYSKSPVAIEGHTDSKGSKAYNKKLSEERATAVRDYLVKQFGVDASRFQIKGYGETRPVAENANSNGRQLNRRVEVRIQNRLEREGG